MELEEEHGDTREKGVQKALRRSEERLAESNDLLRATIDSSMDMIQVFKAVRNKQHEIVDFIWVLNNKAAETVYGDVIGKSLLTLNPGVITEGIFDAFKEVVETGIPQQYEKHYLHEQFDGWFDQSIVKLHDGVTTTTATITERKEAEEEVIRLKDEIAQRATDKYYSLFNSIDDSFHIIELTFDEWGRVADFRYLETNQAFQQHFGLKNVSGKLASEATPGVEDDWMDACAKIVRTGEPLRIAHYNTLTDRWYSTYGFRISSKGNPQIAVLSTDITERKRHKQRQTYLVKLTNALSPLADAAEIEGIACRLLGEELKAGRVFYSAINEPENQVKITQDYRSESLPSLAGTHPLSTYSWAIPLYYEGNPIIINDVYHTDLIPPADLPAMEKNQVISCGVTPIIKNGVLVGTLTASEPTPRKWREYEVALLTETAERIWDATERVKAEKRSAKELEDSKKLQEISKHLIEADDVDSLYDALLMSAIEIMDADCASIQVLLPEKTELYLLAHTGFHPNSAAHWEYVGINSSSTCGKALSSGERVVVSDIEDSFVKSGKEDFNAYRQSGISAIQSTPLISRTGNRVGMISTHWKHVHTPSARQLNLFDVLARQAADLIERRQTENALLVNEERMRFLKEAYQSVVDGKSLAESLHILSKLAVKETSGEARTAFYVANAQGTELHTIRGAGNMPAEYADEIDGFLIGFDSLACGLAVPTGEPVITTDVRGEPLWEPWLFIAEKYDYRGCWSFPIKTKDNQAMGAFAMYFRDPRKASFKDIVLADIVTQSAALIISNYTDIQERERAEQALRESEAQLRQSLKLRDEFIGVASHELKTPVTSMKAYAEIVQERLDEIGLKDDVDLLSKLNTQVDRLTALINNLLDTTKISEGQLQLSPEELNINELLHERIGEIERTCNHRFNAQLQDIPTVMADPERIGQVVTNLLSNAVKYSPKGSTISVASTRGPDGIVVSVRDNGYGIPKADLKKVFDKFFRVTANNMDTFPGMGLGLYIAAQIIQKHRGTISAQSTVGNGSIFSFTLPYHNN